MTPKPLAYASKVGDARLADGLTDHRGMAPFYQFDFFASPPPDIGPVRSAESTLRLDKEPKTLAFKIMIGAAAAALFFIFFSVLAVSQPKTSDRNMLFVVGAIFAAAAPGLNPLLMRFTGECTFVGRDGIARFRVTGSRDAPPVFDGLLFAQAAELRAKKVRQHYNGAYMGTYYTYVWSDPGGRELLKLRGKYNDKKKKPKPGVSYYYARGAEVAWSNFFLNQAGQVLEQEGSIPFRVDRSRWVRVGPGFMEFHFGGEPVRINKSEIAKVTLGNGKFNFVHKDAKWLSRAGKYSFDYGGMGNAQVFLFALDKLMGYRWG